MSQSGVRLSDTRLRALLAQGRAGSQPAVGELLQNFRDYLLAVAQGTLPADVRQKIGASDLVQETLTEGVGAFHRFTGDSADELVAWLCRILEHNVRDAIRRWRCAAKRDVRREVSIDSDEPAGQLHEQLLVSDDSIRQRAIRREERQAVNRALQQLPPAYREIIILRNLEFCSFTQAADTMQISVNAARKLWQRAVKQLAQALEARRATEQDRSPREA